MGFFGEIVARLTLAEFFKAGLAEVNSRLNPDEMISILQQGNQAVFAGFAVSQVGRSGRSLGKIEDMN